MKAQQKQVEKYNQMLTKLINAFNNEHYGVFNKEFEKYHKVVKSLIDILSKQEKTAIFVKQLSMPLKTDGRQTYGAGIRYKGKKLKNGDIWVSGGIPSDSALEKEMRLSELERERLHLAYAREHNIKNFLNDKYRLLFFKELCDATRKHFKYLHTLPTDSDKFLYTANRILPNNTITQAKQKLQKVKESSLAVSTLKSEVKKAGG